MYTRYRRIEVAVKRGKMQRVRKERESKVIYVARGIFPLVLTNDGLGVESGPFVFPLMFGRGFFEEPGSDDPVRGALSFITILAWISSNLVALTFLGQKRVTKL
jgi:hypothetical protein